MRYRSCRHSARVFLCASIYALLVFASSIPAVAQVTIRPSLGLQTMTFVGDKPVTQPISPGPDREERLGGGMVGPHVGARLQFEVASQENAIIRFPLSLEYYFLDGATTFSLSTFGGRKQRLTFTHTANIASGGLGVMVAPTKNPTVYLLAEAKANYIFPTSLEARIYYSDKNETIQQNTVEPSPGIFRIGGYARLGAQLEFFEPLLMDFSVGYGALNLFGKETDPAEERNILIIDSEIREPEETIGYLGLNISLIWKL